MTRIFLSHSAQDSVAHHFCHFLREHLKIADVGPIEVFNSVEPGEDWQTGITEAINRCSVFICFFQRDNPNLMFELGYALAKNKKIILLGDFENLPFDLRSMRYFPRQTHPFEVLSQVDRYLVERPAHSSTFDINTNTPQEAVKALLERPELLDTLASQDFEALIMRWFEFRGLHVQMTSQSRDYGFDMFIEPFRGERASVEVKKYKSESQVPVAIIRQLIGTMTLERVGIGIVIATAPFTKSAHFFVRDIQPKVLLWTLNDLAQIDNDPNINLDEYDSPFADPR